MKNVHNISLDTSSCIGCSLCIKDCPSFNIELHGGKAALKSQNCLKCGHCVAICPKNVFNISGFEDESEIMTLPKKINPEELLYAIKTRRSIRQFSDQKVAPEVVAQIIEAGRFTATAKNMQDVEYIVLDQQKDLYEMAALKLVRRAKKVLDLFSKKYRDAIIDDHYLFKGAPIIILVISECNVNAALAAANMENMAEANNLGVLYSGFFTEASKYSLTIKKMLKLPRKKKLITTLIIGHPAVKYQRTAQKDKAIVDYR